MKDRKKHLEKQAYRIFFADKQFRGIQNLIYASENQNLMYASEIQTLTKKLCGKGLIATPRHISLTSSLFSTKRD